MLDEVQRHCGFCWVLKGTNEAEHRLDQCLERRVGVSIAQSERLRGLIAIHKQCWVCWRCGISQRICDGVEKGRPCRWNGVASVLWLAWFQSSVAAEGGFQGKDFEQYAKWLGRRAEGKIQGVIVSKGMKLLWDQAQHMHSQRALKARKDAVEEKVIKEAIGSAAAVLGADALQGAVVIDMVARRGKVIEWLSRHCIYCEVTERHYSSNKHWHKTCRKSQLVPDECGYDSTLEWQAEMDEFRRGQCWSCKADIDGCGLRESGEVTCKYGDVIMPVIYLLYRRNWLEKWIKQEGYKVGFGVAQLQKWLNEESSKEGVTRSRAVEAFEAYACEFRRV